MIQMFGQYLREIDITKLELLDFLVAVGQYVKLVVSDEREEAQTAARNIVSEKLGSSFHHAFFTLFIHRSMSSVASFLRQSSDVVQITLKNFQDFDPSKPSPFLFNAASEKVREELRTVFLEWQEFLSIDSRNSHIQQDRMIIWKSPEAFKYVLYYDRPLMAKFQEFLTEFHPQNLHHLFLFDQLRKFSLLPLGEGESNQVKLRELAQKINQTLIEPHVNILGIHAEALAEVQKTLSSKSFVSPSFFSSVKADVSAKLAQLFSQFQIEVL